MFLVFFFFMRADIKLIQESQTTGVEMAIVSIHDVKGQSQLSHNACVFKRHKYTEKWQ